MNINDYFGKYDKNNFELLVKYMKNLDKNLKLFYNFKYPFFKGEYTRNFYDYLKTKKLNYKSMTPEKLFLYIAPYFKNIPNWNNPGTMINVIPPVNLTSLAATNIANMYNPNFAQDTYSGMLITSELEVSKYLCDLIGWNWKKAHGTFTFGGKGTNLYATKIALNKVDKNISTEGLEKNKYFMVTSKNGHPCHYEVCNWLGIGTANCYEIGCNEKGQLNLDEAKTIIENNLSEGRIFIGYNLTAGSTNELYVDQIKQIYLMNQEIVKKFKLHYLPHIHADAVLGWVYLFFNDYDYEKNKLKINNEVLKKIKSLNSKIKELKYADSVGIDFHKTGFCPYISSMILFKNKNDYYTLYEADNVDISKVNFGGYNPYHSTLELTRSSLGPLSSLCSLKSLGIEGFQKIISNMFNCAEYFRNKLKVNSRICIINENTEGLATLFIIKPKQYSNFDISNIAKNSDSEIKIIKEYNVNFGKYILNLAIHNKIHFIFTSSRSYELPGTSIKIGALKAYPMSIDICKNIVDIIIKEINSTIDSYDNLNGNMNEVFELSDNMIYR